MISIIVVATVYFLIIWFLIQICYESHVSKGKSCFAELFSCGFFFSLDGLDFYYSSKQHAQKMVEFLQCTVPCRYVLNLNGIESKVLRIDVGHMHSSGWDISYVKIFKIIVRIFTVSKHIGLATLRKVLAKEHVRLALRI